MPWISLFFTSSPARKATSARMSEAFANTFDERPHAYFVSGFTLVIAVQLLSLGIMSFQQKRYFEELFHLSTATYKEQQRSRGW